MSRRDQIRMSDVERDAFIDSQISIFIVSNGKNGFPHPMPMRFAMSAERTFDMTTYKKSQKVLNFRRDPRATIMLDAGVSYEEMRSLIAYCRAEVIDDRELTVGVMEAVRVHRLRICDPQGVEDNAALQAFRETAYKRAGKRLVLRFRPESFVTWDHAKLGGSY